MNPNLGVGFISIFWHLKFLASSSQPFGRIRNSTPHTSLRQSRHSQQKPSTDRWASAAPESDCLPCLCSNLKSQTSGYLWSNQKHPWYFNSQHGDSPIWMASETQTPVIPSPDHQHCYPPFPKQPRFRCSCWIVTPRFVANPPLRESVDTLHWPQDMIWVCLEMGPARGFFSRKNYDKPIWFIGYGLVWYVWKKPPNFLDSLILQLAILRVNWQGYFEKSLAAQYDLNLRCAQPKKKNQFPTHKALSENSVPLHPMVLLIIIPTKWLFFWGYTPFPLGYPLVN